MESILIINGPNINMLGKREDIYPTCTYSDMCKEIKKYAKEIGVKVKIIQSNYEGKIVSIIQKAKKHSAIIINAAAYTHTSIAILDALKTYKKMIIEIHLTDTSKREEYRQKSYISEVSDVKIAGLGVDGYKKALDFAKNKQK